MLRELTGQIRSHKTVKVASSNSAHRESTQGPVGYRDFSQGPVLRGNIQPWERTEARMGVRLIGRAMLGQTVVAAIIYGFTRMDLTGKLSTHIYAPDLGPNVPSYVIFGLDRSLFGKAV